MSCFTSQVDGMTVTEPDPTKHVKYNLGMVLGVDDFTQEFAYLSGRDQWLARDLIGYGTARGLQVTVDEDAKGPRVMVDPGVAISPKGQMICVPSAQCAYLNQWLTANAKELNIELQSPPGSDLKVYVVLCYRDCPTDKVPIPGEPCRSEADLTAPSRLTDDFQLELRLKAPKQREEDALRDFVAWLRLIEISDSLVSSISLEQFGAAIREAAKPWLSPLTSPISSPLDSPPSDFMFGSPPASLQISASEAFDYMRAAFRIWTTELRPKWIGRWHGCAPDNPGGMSLEEENCVLLAALNIPVLPTSPHGDFVVDDSSISSVEIDESKRPFLLHLRMLQEWLLGRGRQVLPSDDQPTNLGRYLVVAAGIVSKGEDPSSFNQLKLLKITEDGRELVTFKGYRQPTANSGSRYVVKVLPKTNKKVKMPIVTFDGFEEAGFALRIADGATPVVSDVLATLELMIEVSEYTVGRT